MKILIISYYFPPYNTIGAVRVGKIAKYLRRHGNQVKVISALNQPLPLGLPVEIDEEDIIRTRWIDVNKIPELIIGGRKKVVKTGYAGGNTNKIVKLLGGIYKSITNIPDGQIGWYWYAVSAGIEMFQEWKPDYIYASAMPYTSLLVANKLSAEYKIPWIAELRDLWADNYNHKYGIFRRKIDDMLERSTLQKAKGIVTVSEALATQIRKKYDIPVAVIYNGYDHEDFEKIARTGSNEKAVAKIIYTGTIYEGKQDIETFIKGVKRAVEKGTTGFEVEIYGRNVGGTKSIIDRYGLSQIIKINNPVPYTESLSLQKSADALLLLSWNDKTQKGVYTGKLFEYLGARRPILAVGPEDDVAASLVRTYGFGKVASNEVEVAQAIAEIVEGKYIYPGREEVRIKFTREKQVFELENFLQELQRK